jgi:hypothetical protein
MPEVSLQEIPSDDEWQYTEYIEDTEDDEDDQIEFTGTQKKIIAGGIVLAILVPVLAACWALSPFGRSG